MANTDICPFCEKIVKTRDKAICCDLRSKWIRIKCNNLNNLGYEMTIGTVRFVFRKYYHLAIKK